MKKNGADYITFWQFGGSPQYAVEARGLFVDAKARSGDGWLITTFKLLS
jgi:hypothetical protein